MDRLRILELRSVPQFTDQVADWLHEEWYSHRADTLAQVRHRLQVDRRAGAFSTTFVGACERGVVGTFTLEESTQPRSDQPLFCLSNVFVAKTSRRHGIGRELCEAAVEQARMMRIPRLTLFTGSLAPYYAGMGWEYIDIVAMDSRGREEPVFVMRRDVGVFAQPGRRRRRPGRVRSEAVAVGAIRPGPAGVRLDAVQHRMGDEAALLS